MWQEGNLSLRQGSSPPEAGFSHPSYLTKAHRTLSQSFQDCCLPLGAWSLWAWRPQAAGQCPALTSASSCGEEESSLIASGCWSAPSHQVAMNIMQHYKKINGTITTDKLQTFEPVILSEEGIISHWKHELASFEQSNHEKYINKSEPMKSDSSREILWRKHHWGRMFCLYESMLLNFPIEQQEKSWSNHGEQ